MENWDDYRIFLAVARAASVRRAASELGVSHSTVLRRITNLEQALGARLFDRMPTGYFTTEAGDDLFSTVEKIEKETHRASRRLQGRDRQLSGKMSITMPGVLATHLLMPDLNVFRQTYPGIELKIISAYSDADLSRREADVAIRVSNDPPEDLFGRRILGVARAVYASKSYLEKLSHGSKGESVSWLGWPGVSSSEWIGKSDFSNAPVETIINDPHAVLAGIKAGMGIGVLPCFVGDTEDDLCRMPPGTSQVYKSLWVLTHEDLRNVARIRIFISFLADAISNYHELVTGMRPKTD